MVTYWLAPFRKRAVFAESATAVDMLTLSRPMIWSGEVWRALSSTQRSSSVLLTAQGALKVKVVPGTVVMPTVLGTTTPLLPLMTGFSVETLLHVAPLSRL